MREAIFSIEYGKCLVIASYSCSIKNLRIEFSNARIVMFRVNSIQIKSRLK